MAGYITRKHVYEIAKLKSEDSLWQMFDLEDICQHVIDHAYTIGIHVKDDLDPEWYAEFLEERKTIVEAQLAAIKEAKEAKLLRTLSTAAA